MLWEFDPEAFFRIAPIVTSAIALAVSVAGFLISRRSLGLARKEFWSNRTLLLTCSVRPSLGAEFQKLVGSSKREDELRAGEMMHKAIENSLLVFVPSVKPNLITDLTIFVPRQVSEHTSLHIGNVSTGHTTAMFVKNKLIGEGEFAFPALLFASRLWSFLKRITPASHKVDFGTLNMAEIPVVLAVKLIAKGEIFEERQLYGLEISFTVNERDEALVHGLRLNFNRRIKAEDKIEALLEQEMPQYGIKFLSSPLPRSGALEEAEALGMRKRPDATRKPIESAGASNPS